MAVSFYSQDCNFLPTGRRKIAAWVKDTVREEGFTPGDITFIFCSPEYHLALNRQYLGHDYQTDVITFDYSNINPDGGGIVSGDIFIDPTQTASQAAQWGAPKEEELYRVMIHGVLHLCGYKDKTKPQQSTMRSKENTHLTTYKQLHGIFKI